MAVPYTFGSATTSIPLSQLDSNFATTITLGNTAVQLGNTITNLTGVSNVASATSLSLGSNGNTTAITVDTSQNVGIGTTAPTATLDVRASTGPKVQVKATTGTSYAFAGFSNTGGDFNIGRDSSTGGSLLTGSSAYAAVLNSFGSYPMQFGTSGTLAMTIDSSQNVLVGTTSRINTEKCIVQQSGDNNAMFVYGTSTSQTADVFQIRCASTTANASYKLLVANNGSGTRFQVFDSGNVQNTNNSYGAISDVNLKENIVDATPKLADLMQVKVRNYNLKADETKTKQIGVVAQELETVFPSMIETDNDGTKGVKYSVFVPILIKAIQEQQALITAQAETINALTARIVALEAK